MAIATLKLPWPPSVNTYWRHPSSGPLAGRHLISREGRDYRKQVALAVLYQSRHKHLGKVAVTILAYPSSRRRSDLDNLAKAILDSLTHAGIWDDDFQIDRLLIERQAVDRKGGGYVTVSIESLSER